jgi:hypothetical protein
VNRWIFLGGTAVVGLLLYLIFKVSHPGEGGNRGFPAQGDALSRESRWNDLAPPDLPLPGRSAYAPVLSPAGNHGSPVRKEEHPLDTRSTVYLDGIGSAASDPGQEPKGQANGPDALILSTLKNVLGPSGEESRSLARAARKIREGAGGREIALSGSRKITAGSELHVSILKTVEGPGNQMPVIGRIRADSVAAFHLPAGTKILGYPEGLGGGDRLRIRFYRILYPGGFEAHTTGFALSGGREGVPVEVSRHTGENMAKSMAQSTMMLGGEAVGSMGWSGTDMGSFMAMQEGGSALAQAGSQMPVPNYQATFHLARGTDCDVMILESFPVPGPGKSP